MKNIKNTSLFGFYALYFVALGVTTFTPKYFGEIGMSDSQIGIIMSVPGIIGIFFQPVWGVLSDRVKFKRIILSVSCFVGGSVYLLTGMTNNFWLILTGMTVITLFFLPITPVSSSIAMENAANGGPAFGPIRMGGTIGYQVGALAIGFILINSLEGMFAVVGVLVILCGGLAFLLPDIGGHQHGREKVSILVLLKNKKILLLLTISFVTCTTSAFYMTFFTKHLGDIGVGNGVTGIITVISVLLEIPFLFFAQRLYKKLSIWHWVLIGLFLNGLRWIGLGLVQSVPLILISNIPAVSIMACFEFFPALYLNDNTPDELKGSAQSLLSLTTFGITKISGSLLGGFLSNAFGIQTMFIANGILLLAATAIFIFPCIKMINSEKSEA